jgi:ABC-type dipeptide/oligopeptide/nickel transport system ATPase component
MTTTPIQTIPYTQFLRDMQHKWKQGQHISLVGPTGSGKTVAARDLVALRDYLVVIATKAKDASLNRYKLVRRSDWPPNWDEEKILLWVKPKQLGDFSRQTAIIYYTLNDIYRTGGWTAYFDDVFYITNTLGLKRPMQMMYTQARSNNISLIGSLQRPRNVPVEVINQSTFLLLFKVRDRLDIERVAEEMSVDRQELFRALSQLQDYEFTLLETGKAPMIVRRAMLTP